ncbi:MAG: ATP-binding cassette domain-containing protein [Armatimonadetes bacterium]|nr:ATP-binding cassette domain-containing protein [Armatimonadota bacterium]
MIKTENLCKSFIDPKKGPVHAVKNVSFEAQVGEIFGLLGVNGAGKTTCLRMLSTVIAPTSGHASVNGFDVVTHGQEVRGQIGFLSTSTALYGRLTAREMLTYFGELNQLSPARLKERLEFVIEKLRLQEYIDRQCDKLSTGQKQRVSISRAILHDPPVIFFDEPTAGLDVVTSQTIMEFIEETKAQGKTVVFSTHIMSEAERLCDKIAVIHAGEIKATGTVADLLAQTQANTLEKAFLNLVGYQQGQVNE